MDAEKIKVLLDLCKQHGGPEILQAAEDNPKAVELSKVMLEAACDHAEEQGDPVLRSQMTLLQAAGLIMRFVIETTNPAERWEFCYGVIGQDLYKISKMKADLSGVKGNA